MPTATLKTALHLVVPDRIAMDAARVALQAHVVSLKLDFLPVMKDRMPYLQTTLSVANRVFNHTLATFKAQLDNITLQAITLKRERIIADMKLSDPQKERALKLIDDLLFAQVTQLNEVIRGHANAIARSSDDLAQIDLKLENNRLEETLQRQLEALAQRSAEWDAQMSTLAEDRKVLDALINTLEQHNLANQFKDMLPSVEELALLTAPSPELAVAQAGLKKIAQLLDGISRAITYADLTAERDRLRARYNDALENSRSARQEAKSIVQNLDTLTGLKAAEQSKMAWVLEATKVYESLRTFVTAQMSADTATEAVEAHISELKTYLALFYAIKRIV